MAQNSQQVCPHWSAKDRSCLLSQRGLYLPVAEHIEIYCEGGNFSSCSQYMAQTFPPEGAPFSDNVVDHRRFRRVPGRFSFRLAERAGDSLNQLIDDAATTVDFSPGGIRFESYRSLHRGAEVLFSLNGDFSDAPLQGIGRVKWCRSLENAPLYHAGIAFADPAVAAAISERLGLSVN
jgi:hypothetical protein